MSAYTGEFYDLIRSGCVDSAAVVVPLLTRLVRPKSVLDVGCGEGWWLREFTACSVPDVHGVEGEWLAPDRLAVPVDLTHPELAHA